MTNDPGTGSIRCGVLGSGNMGVQIAECLAEHGFDTVLRTRDMSRREKIAGKISGHIHKRHDEGESAEILSRIRITGDLSDLRGCDVVFESIVENLDAKCALLDEVTGHVGKDAMVLSNTSALSIAEMRKHHARLYGFHFFNPLRSMKLVEIIAEKDSEDAGFLVSLAEAMGKTPVFVPDRPGFIVNRLLLSQINSAVRMCDSGLFDQKDIDIAIKLGLNHPMGPFELADYIGLDVCLFILNEMYDQLGDPYYKPADSIVRLVEQGDLGRKTGKGFYTYR